MTGDELLRLATAAQLALEAECDRRFQQADLASAYIRCAADLLDRGEYAHALQLCRRAGEVCEPYRELHAQLGGAS